MRCCYLKPNPLACALLVLLAVAVQLPAQNTNTANAPKWEETQPVSQSVTNATGTNKTSAGDIFDQVAAGTVRHERGENQLIGLGASVIKQHKRGGSNSRLGNE